MKRTLPRSLDDVGGMRAARWFRESTAGQWDNFGPDAQREQQDRAIERYGLVDAGLEWSVASSGWTSAWRTATWEAMIGSATGGCLRRPRRRLRQPLPAQPQADAHRGRGPPPCRGRRRPLRRRAAALARTRAPGTSSSARPTRPRPTAASCRKRVSEGYAAKRRRLGVPGGNRMPYGLVREGKPSVLRVDEEKAAVVVRAYQLAATGLDRLGGGGPDRPRQDPRRRGPHQPHLRRAGCGPARSAAIAPIVDPALWSTVQTMRERRRTRTPGPHREGRLRPAPLLRRLREVPLRRRRPVSASAADLRGVPGGEAGRPPSAARMPGPHRHPHQGPLATRRSGTRTPSVSCSARSGASTTTP